MPGLEPLALTGLSFTLGGMLLLTFAALTGAALASPRGASVVGDALLAVPVASLRPRREG